MGKRSSQNFYYKVTSSETLLSKPRIRSDSEWWKTGSFSTTRSERSPFYTGFNGRVTVPEYLEPHNYLDRKST